MGPLRNKSTLNCENSVALSILNQQAGVKGRRSMGLKLCSKFTYSDFGYWNMAYSSELLFEAVFVSSTVAELLVLLCASLIYSQRHSDFKVYGTYKRVF